MNRSFGWLICLSLLCRNAAAGQDFGCMQSCYERGLERSQCITLCGGGAGAGALAGQAGLPGNPAFDAVLPKPLAPPPPKVVDPKCYQDCRKRGYHPQLCQRQCSWGGDENWR